MWSAQTVQSIDNIFTELYSPYSVFELVFVDVTLYHLEIRIIKEIKAIKVKCMVAFLKTSFHFIGKHVTRLTSRVVANCILASIID